MLVQTADPDVTYHGVVEGWIAHSRCPRHPASRYLYLIRREPSGYLIACDEQILGGESFDAASKLP